MSQDSIGSTTSQGEVKLEAEAVETPAPSALYGGSTWNTFYWALFAQCKAKGMTKPEQVLNHIRKIGDTGADVYDASKPLLLSEVVARIKYGNNAPYLSTSKTVKKPNPHKGQLGIFLPAAGQKGKRGLTDEEIEAQNKRAMEMCNLVEFE